MTKIKINPIFWILIVGSFLTGQFVEVITLFGIVLIHEIGHVFTAKSYGWKVIEIQLLPFGGMAKVEQSSDSLWEEFIVAVAGPLQNLIMIFVAMGFLRLNLWSDSWTTFFIQANILIGLFNLLPISPLDGSRIIKVFFYMFLSFRKALTVSNFFSFVLALIFFIWSTGLVFGNKMNLNGMVLAIFFIYTNWVDVRHVPYLFWQFLLNKQKTSPKLNRPVIPLIVNHDMPIIKALYLLRKEKYHIFYLMSPKGEISTVIPEEKLLKIIFNEKKLYQPIDQIVV